MPSSCASEPRPRLVWAGYLHPWPLCAGLVLALNDHVLKHTPQAPRWLTGKLSDVAGLFFFPLLATALLHLATRRRAAGHLTALRTRHLAAICLATGLAFAAIQLVPAAADLYRASGASVATLLDPLWRARPTVTMDPADLLALPALALAFLHGRRFLDRTPAPSAPPRRFLPPRA